MQTNKKEGLRTRMINWISDKWDKSKTILSVLVKTMVILIALSFLFLVTNPLETTQIGIFWIYVILIGVPTIILVGLFVAWHWLARPRHNRWFTFIGEKWGKIITKGRAYCKTMIQDTGYVLDKDDYVVPANAWIKDHREVAEGTAGAIKSEKEKKPWLGGFRYYGFWPFKDVHTYYQRWTSVKEGGEIDFHPKEVLDKVYLGDDFYYLGIGRKVKREEEENNNYSESKEESEDLSEKPVEDKDGVPLIIDLILTLRVVNPKKAIFDTANWIEAVINRTRPYVREFIGGKSFKELYVQRKAAADEMMAILENRGMIAEFFNNYGVDLRHIELMGVDPTDEYRAITTAKVEAERKAEATVVAARANKKSIEINAQAEKNRIKTVYGAIINIFGDKGVLLKIMEDARDSKLAPSLALQTISIPELREKAMQPVDDTNLQKLQEVFKRLSREDIIKLIALLEAKKEVKPKEKTEYKEEVKLEGESEKESEEEEETEEE